MAMVQAMTAKIAWVRDPAAPAGVAAQGSFRCVCGTVTGGQDFPGPGFTCRGCGRGWDGRGWALHGPTRGAP